MIALFNGNLILEKTNRRFISWLQARNQKENCSSCKVSKEIVYCGKNEITQFDQNGWLSSFIDSDGCFYVSKQNDERYSLGWRVRLRFILDQKGEALLLQKIKLFLGSGAINERFTSMHRFTSTSLKSHEILVNYLSKYPLRSKKKMDFLRWVKIKRYIETRKIHPWKGNLLKRVETLIANNNSHLKVLFVAVFSGFGL